MPTSLVQELLQARYSEFAPTVLEVIDVAVSQGLMPTDTEVGERVLAKIVDLKQPMFRGSEPVTPLEMTQRIEAALAYESELQSMTDDELRELYRDNHKKRSKLRHRKALHYDIANFGHPKHEPDFEIWNRKIVWSVREAICLSLDKEPSTTDLEPSILPGSILKDEYELRKNALISLEIVDLDTKKPIDFFVRWFRERNLLVPAKFGDTEHRDVSDPALEIEKLQAMIGALQSELDKSKPGMENRRAIHALLYCMAVKKFQYNPTEKYGSAAKQIEECTESLATLKGNYDLKVSNNTVRAILRNAAIFLSEFHGVSDTESTAQSPSGKG